MRSAYHAIHIVKEKCQSVRKTTRVKRIKHGVNHYRRTAASRRMLSVLLVLALIATSTPAASRTLVAAAAEWKAAATFWLLANDVPATIYRTVMGQNPKRPKAQEKQEERNARIARIEIQPGKRIIVAGDELQLSAIAYDYQDVPVGGVSFNWNSDYPKQDPQSGILPDGAFVTSVPGEYMITAEAQGIIASVKVRVLEKVSGGPVITRRVSSDSIDRPTKLPRGTQRAHAAPYYQSEFVDGDPKGWNSTNKPAAFIPQNERGETPGRSTVEANSNNFRITTPIVSLPGRGIDLDLNLVYSSRVWSKANNAANEIIYDADRDQIAPGWSLNFARIINMVDAGAFLIDGDGTRHSFSGNVTYNPVNNERYFSGQTTDGSFIQYGVITRGIGTGTVDTYGTIIYPDGKTLRVGGALSIENSSNIYVLYTRKILDNNGNYIYINYSTGKLRSIVDTLGRIVTFHYDSNQLLTAVTAAGLKDDNGVVTNRTLIRLHYKQLTLNATFQGLTPVVNASPVWGIDAIYYPATEVGQWFGDSNSYSSYGMIRKVSERKSMTFSEAPLTEQGTMTAGTAIRELVYDYPEGPSNLSDAPGYDEIRETWEGSTSGEAVTQFDVVQEGETRKITTTLPDQTKTIEYTYAKPGQYDNGLVYKVEIVDGSTVVRTIATQWEPGYSGTARVKRRDFTDERNQTSYQTFGYGDHTGFYSYNQIAEIKDFDYGGNLLRSRTWNYVAQNYGSLYSGLPSEDRPANMFYRVTRAEVFAADGTRVDRTDYNYDDYSPWPSPPGTPYTGKMMNAPGVTSHSPYFDPYFFSWYLTFGYGARGNVTSVVKYENAANLTGPITTSVIYDKTGNVRKVTIDGKQGETVFTSATQYAYPTSQTIGPSTPDPAAEISISSTYDFNTGLQLSVTDPNSRPRQSSYYLDSWRLKQEIAPTGANTLYEYDDADLSVTRTTKGSDGTIAEKSVAKTDGRGQTIRVDALAPNDAWDVVETQYDSLGRMVKGTLPYRSGQTPRWKETFYDALGRITRAVAPDQSETRTFYNETARPSAATSTPGQAARTVDPWGRERWMLTDALERIIEVVEPDPDGNGSVLGTGSLLTKISYDTLGNPIQIDQGEQQRRFSYDSLGRLTKQKLAEADATLNDAGQYVGTGQWSNVFGYDVRSNLLWKVDARGAKTNFVYNNDPLDRLQSVSFDTSGVGGGHLVHPAATVTYQYMTTGDLTRPRTITASDVSTETFDYDTEGRLKEKTLLLASRPGFPMLIEYAYDSLSRITDVHYPVQHGMLGDPRKSVHHDYDIASRVSGLKVDGADYASQIAYNAASQQTSVKVGTGTNQVTESYEYDPVTSLLSRQRVQFPEMTLLDLSYDYLRDGTTSGRSGQLTRLINNLNSNRSRNYTYDALGRLKQASGGSISAPIWTQTYGYDRFGNRLNVISSGLAAWNRGFLKKEDANQTQVALKTVADDNEIAESHTDSEAATTADQSHNDETTRKSSSLRLHHAKLRAAAASPLSAPTFTDDPLNTPEPTIIRAVHITELRDAIDAVRGLKGLAEYPWEESVAVGGYIKASHISEMRTALDQALGAPAQGYSAGLAQGLPILAIHIQELRDRIKASWNSLSQIPRDGHSSLTYSPTSNRITTDGFEYDAAGNQTRVVLPDGSAQSYEYDAANRMVKVRNQGGVLLASYTYGEGNRRLIAQDGDDNSNQRTYYVWTGGGVMTEYTETPTIPTSPRWSRNYVYLEARLLATQDVNGTGELVQYHHPDRLGTRIMTRADGSWSEQVTLPFGVEIPAESMNEPSNRRFTVYDRSAMTGLDYAVNRSYDSSQGRFTQVDKIGMEAADVTSPQTLNLYAYCANDPINSVDPEGNFGFSISFGGFFGGFFGGGQRPDTRPSGILGGLLAGLLNFGLGVLGSILGSLGPTFFGWPFIGIPQIPGRRPSSDPGPPAPTTISVSQSFPQEAAQNPERDGLSPEHLEPAIRIQTHMQTASRISAAGTAFIAQWERFEPRIYDTDGGGHCTIGYGHLLHRGNCTAADRAAYPNGVTQQQALNIFQNDLAQYEQVVNNNVRVPLTQNQFDALMSFAFNLGPSQFARSSAVRRLNKGFYNEVPARLLRWNTSNGVPLRGLTRRRTDEGRIFNTP